MNLVRIAVLSDIHGNAAALEAVLDDIERADVDRVYVLGDVVNGGPEPEVCWTRVRERADGILAGNHERYVLSAAARDPRFDEEAWGPAHWTARQMSLRALAELEALPATIELDASGRDHSSERGTLLCHASPRSDDDMMFPDTPADDVRPMLAGVPHATVVRGHNHEVFERTIDGVRVIAIGAVGLSFGDRTGAEYTLLEAGAEGWIVRNRRVRYDVEATLRACRDTGYLEDAGPVARLFAAEIATGRKHLSPFMRTYYEPSEHDSLRTAVDRYLR